MKRLLRMTLAVSLLAMFSSAAMALEFTVNSTQDQPDINPGDGECNPANLLPPACTLRAAIMEANALGGSHTINVPPGTYLLTRPGIDEDDALTGDLDIRADITIANDSDEFVLLGQTVGDRFFEVHPSGKLTLQRVAMFGGQALNGTRPYGGAVFVWYSAQLLASQSYFLQNSATRGGAIYSWGDVLLFASDLRENYLVDASPDTNTQGAAITMHREIFGPARLEVLASSFSGNGRSDEENHASQTYALHVRGGALAALTNTSVIDNSRGIWGSGGSQVGLLSTTIAGNDGFGLRFDHNPNDESAQLQILLSVITGNRGVSQCRSENALFLNPNLSQVQVSDQFNASSDLSCGFNGASDVALNGWPFHPDIMQADFSRYYQPVPGRGLVDTGGEDCESLDQRGGDRPLNGSGLPTALCDIGAIEFNPDSDPLLPDRIFGDRFEDK